VLATFVRGRTHNAYEERMNVNNYKDAMEAAQAEIIKSLRKRVLNPNFCQ
jgi:hypothetical protein